MTRTALYRHYDAQGRLLYVGISDCLAARDAQHRAAAPWHRDVHRSNVVWFDTRAEARDAEAAAIKTELPLHNIMLSVAGIAKHVATLRAAPRGPGKSFKDWLKEKGIKQTDAASWMGESRSFLCEVCNGTKSPGLRLAVMIEDFTGGEITVRDLADFYEFAQAGKKTASRHLVGPTASVGEVV